MKKTILVRGVDDDAYRRAKATAALRGVTIGGAISEALQEWVKAPETTAIDKEIHANRAYVRKSWDSLREHQGKVVVIQGGRLAKVFDDYESARAFSSKFDVALVFQVNAPPVKRELEIGAEMEV